MHTADQHYWNRAASHYDRSMRLLGGPMPRVLELVEGGVHGKGDVLEVAAGTGLVSTRVAPRVGRLVATDYAPSMVERLRDRTSAHDNVEVMQADLFDLPFAPASFDTVVAANVLHLVPDVGHALCAMRRVLKPGGTLIVPTFVHDQTALSWSFSRLLALTGFPAKRRFTAGSLQAAVERAEFRIRRVETVPGLIPVGFVEARVV